MTLNITDVTVKDTIDLLAKTCELTLTPASKENPPVAEFRYPGDEATLTGTSLRPNGAILDINNAYANIPLHLIFSGLIEFMDDLEDADKYIFQVQMSDMPRNQPHRTKLTMIFNQVNSSAYSRPGCVSAHSILNTLCTRVGITFGRCDLPDYKVWGTYEVIRETVVEVAQRLIGAFNTFDHTKYRVRCDRNGLQIIKIDYTKGGEVSNTYALSNIISRQRSFEMYMPESRVGDSDVLISGADRYGYTYGTTIIDANTNEDELTIDPNAPVVKKYTVTHVFTSSSNTTRNDVGPLDIESWGEAETTVEYDIEATFATGVNYNAFVLAKASWPVTPDDVNFTSDWTRFLDAYSEGQLLNIAVATTRIVKSVQRQYNSTSGLISKTETHYTFETKAFKKHLWEEGTADSKVVVSQETVVEKYPFDSLWPNTMQRVGYTYDDWGNNDSVTTKQYNWDGRGWALQTTTVDHNSSQEAANAEIQWQAAEAQYRANEGDRAAERLNARLSNSGPRTYSSTYENDQSSESNSTPIGRYQLMNGLVFSTMPVNPAISGLYPRIGYSAGPHTSLLPQPISAALTNIWDANNNIMIRETKARCAFQMSQEGMDYDGLRLLWALVQQEQELEKKNPYWEINQITASIDTSPAVGESIVIGGTSGIVDSVTHHLNADEALTSVVVRRLIYDV